MSRNAASPSTITQDKLVEYERYADAQRAVDQLSDQGFPVKNVSIVWSRLRQVEYVTGRRTVATAARDGALSGLWFGGFLGVLLSLFVELDEDASVFGLIITYAAAGAVLNAIFMAYRHWSQRGARDFSTVGKLDAEAYEVWVDREYLTQATGILGVSPPRPADEDT
jgi:hypothetical protein